MDEYLPSDKILLNTRKQELEVQKLKAEIIALQRPVWAEPSVFVPVFLALCTLFGAWTTGYFDATRLRLQAQDARLNRQIDELKAAGETILDSLTDANAFIMKTINEKNGDLDTLDRELKSGNTDRQPAIDIVSELVSRIQRIKPQLEANQKSIETLRSQLSKSSSP